MQGLRITAPKQELNINDPDYDYGNVWPLNVNAIARTVPRGNSDPPSGWRNLSWANKPNGTKPNIRKLAENINYAYSEPLTSDKYSRYRQLIRKSKSRHDKLLPTRNNILSQLSKNEENLQRKSLKRDHKNISANNTNFTNINNINNIFSSNAKRQTLNKSAANRKTRKARKANIRRS
jgi:hypothetical protein